MGYYNTPRKWYIKQIQVRNKKKCLPDERRRNHEMRREGADMAKKYYVVKKGKVCGIYFNWNDCKAQIDGFSGAEYKGFDSLSDAQSYLEGAGASTGGASTGGASADAAPAAGESAKAEMADTHPHAGADKAVAYVDGSFDGKSGTFSYGMVIFHDGEELHFSEKIEDPALAEMHNVAGEIKGAEAAMQFCVDRKIPSLDLYHDYEGIAKWCEGAWQAKKEGTAAYVRFYRSVKDRLRVRFIKVKGHSGDRYNDLADRLAKDALGIK